jgi:diadenosine tetraphosphate (Ap4A) HIT family hydrolase
MSADNNLVNTSNTWRPGGDDTYKKVIEGIKNDGVCPFCPEQLEKYHKNPIIKQGPFWTLTTNMYPYKNAKYHFLLILKAHKNDTKELSAEEWTELHEHTNWLVDKYKLLGGTLMMRCGDTTHTGASVTHLHAHLVAPDFENKEREPIMARVG